MHDALEAYVREHGVNAFYDSVELRKRCCAIRKIEPLARALAGKRRLDHRPAPRAVGDAHRRSTSRSSTPRMALPKFNPLADWSEDDVWAYMRAHDVPYNPLHDRGYPSIGCAPCTRAVAPGEDVRAGRWWWESREHKECGLHRRPLDVAVRVEAASAQA